MNEVTEKMYTCNKCGDPLTTNAVVGQPVAATEGDEPYFPIAIVFGCTRCSLIISNRLLITNLSPKEIAKESR